MTFDEVLAQVLDLLQRQGRVSYGALKRRFQLDDAYLNDLKAELIDAQRLAIDEQDRVLVWTGAAGAPPASAIALQDPPLTPFQKAPLSSPPASPASLQPAEAERRHLTVLFCDLVGSTALSGQMDPEELREVIQAYQQACAEVIRHFDGHIAQYLGDGLLVYFGYPQAHEDDAQRAVHTGLGIVQALRTLNTRVVPAHVVRLAVRVGIHTGLVVVGAMGGGRRQERLALGDTPNLAARLQSLALPDTVLLSAATWQLVQGYFTCQALGPQTLRGVPTAVHVYQAVQESGAQSRLDVASTRGLTPLVGREVEVALLRARWAEVQDGQGHVIALSGEAGIGKSRLVQVLKDHIAEAPHIRIECRCSPYYQNSAFYPIIDYLERALHFQRDDAPETKLARLERSLAQYRLPLHEAVPLFTALLSLPLPEARYAPLPLTPERHKQKMLEATLANTLELAERRPVLFILEDLHWADPSTLEFLQLLLTQGPTTAILTVVTYRPDFQPPWGLRTHLTPLALQRLSPAHVEAMVTQVAGGNSLPAEILRHVVANTDGVPLFIEELTKTIVESGILRQSDGHYTLTGPFPTLAIPSTLQDALMARLDRLNAVKAVAQLGATLGRTFTYDLLQALTPLDEAALQQGLRQLVAAEMLYQRGIPPRATYRFKHALLQEAAYQSLLKSTRQQYHQHIAQVLESQFPEMVATQPELLAHHCTEAGLAEQAVTCWQQAGQQAVRRSAYVEALHHFTTALALLTSLPDSPERTQQELTLHLAMSVPLMATKGYAAPEVEHAYARAREICQHMGNTPQLFPVLRGLAEFYVVRGELHTACTLGEQLLSQAQSVQHPTLLLGAHTVLGVTLFYIGEFASSRAHLAQGMAHYDSQQHRVHASRTAQDPGVLCLTTASWALWGLGYADQALEHIHEALALAGRLAHPHSLVRALIFAAGLHMWRREEQTAQERADAAITLSTEQGFPLWVAAGTSLRGWALAMQGHNAAGIAQLRQGLDAWRATGAEVARPYFLALLAEAYKRAGHAEDGRTVLAEALELVHKTGERFYAGELYRLQGELLLERAVLETSQVESCCHQALDIARRQQAKSLELRAAMSLARLWQRQDKRTEAHQLLTPVYDWFTEGFGTADLQAARALLAELA